MEAPYVILLCAMACFVGFGLYQKKLEEVRAKQEEDRKSILRTLLPAPKDRPSEPSSTVVHDGPEGSLPGEEILRVGTSEKEEVPLEIDPDWAQSRENRHPHVEAAYQPEVDPGWIGKTGTSKA